MRYDEYLILESIFSSFPGKRESRIKEFNIISKYINRSPQIKIFSLPAEYGYELDLFNSFAGKTKILSFGTDYNIKKLYNNAKQISSHYPLIVPYITTTSADINDIIVSPNAYKFCKVTKNGINKSECLNLPTDNDLIDLDYTGLPIIRKQTSPNRVNLNPSSFDYVNKAGNYLKSKGLLCVTFLLHIRGLDFLTYLKKRDTQYFDLLKSTKPSKLDYFNITEPNPEHYEIAKAKSHKQGPTTMHRYKTSAISANDYINQIINSEFGGTKLDLIWANMYKGGVHGGSIMWRGIFRKK